MSFLRVFGFVLLLSSVGFAQEISRAEKIKKIDDLRSQITSIEKEILQPGAKDIAAAAKMGFSAIRLLPREKYDKVLAIRGGGAYYSFARKVQEYGYGSDISLEQGRLGVGFAGADYGLIRDLGDVPLETISKTSGEAFFLLNYKPPSNEPEIRVEQRRSHEYDANGVIYKSWLPSVIGHTYILRSISFDTSDILVAFNVQRKDADGSIIVFWKTIETFDKPVIARGDVAEVAK